MIFWAFIVSPDSTSALICSFCWSVNVTPTRLNAVRPLTGSLSALPTRIEDDLRSMSPPLPPAIAAAMSWVIATDWSKTLLFLPASFRMFLKVSSMLAPLWITSSSMPDFRESAVDRSPTCFAVTPAAFPVDLMTCSVRAPTFCDSRASAIESLPSLNAASPTALNAAAPRNAARLACDVMLDVRDLPAELPNRRPPLAPADDSGPDVPDDSFDSKPFIDGMIWRLAYPTFSTRSPPLEHG